MKYQEIVRAHQNRMMRKYGPKEKSVLLRLAPELGQRVPMQSEYPLFAGGDDDIIADYVGHARQYRVYPWLQKAVSLTAEMLSQLPMTVVDTKRKGKVIDNHRIASVLNYPSDRLAGNMLRTIEVIHMLLGGECFLEIVDNANGEIREIWPRRPDRTLVIPDRTRLAYPAVAAYRFLELSNDPKDVIPSTSVIHTMIINPLSQWRGLSPVTAALAGIRLDRTIQQKQNVFVDNDSRPDYVMSFPEIMTSPERKRIQEQIRLREPGMPIIVDAAEGVAVYPLTIAPKDTEGIELRKYSRDEVAAIFGVPDILMGYGDDSYDTEEKRVAALKMFWNTALIPFIQRRDNAYNHFFHKIRPSLKDNERIQTDLSSVDLLNEDVKPKVEIAQALWAMGVPFNVLDDRLGLGIGKIPGGDTGFISTSVASSDQAELRETREDVAEMVALNGTKNGQ